MADAILTRAESAIRSLTLPSGYHAASRSLAAATARDRGDLRGQISCMPAKWSCGLNGDRLARATTRVAGATAGARLPDSRHAAGAGSSAWIARKTSRPGPLALHEAAQSGKATCHREVGVA